MASSKLTGRLKDMSFSRSGKQIISIEVNEDFREAFDSLAADDLDIEIKKHRQKRSLDSNSYAWVLIDHLSAAMKLPKEEVYQRAVRNIGGVSEIVCIQEKAYKKFAEIWSAKGIGWLCEKMPSKIDGCVNAVLYYGSSAYDTEQMSNLISLLVEDCKALGIPTMTPDEILELESKWKNAR